MRLTSLRHRLEYTVVVAVRFAARVLPEAVVRWLGAALGFTYYVLDARHRRLAVQQLQAAFPERGAAECRAIARGAFAHFGRALTLLLKFSWFSHEELKARIELDGAEHLRAAQALGKGVLYITGHFGYWELYNLAHPLVLNPTTSVARPLDNPLLHRLLETIRTSTGNKIVYKRSAMRPMLRALLAGDIVGVLIDQYSGTLDSAPVEFFGRPAPTSSVMAALALRTSAPIVPFFALPLPGGRFRVVIEPPIALPEPGAAEPVRELTQRCNDVLEKYVRQYPHLWLWMHRRWREPPVSAAAATAAGAPEPEA